MAGFIYRAGGDFGAGRVRLDLPGIDMSHILGIFLLGGTEEASCRNLVPGKPPGRFIGPVTVHANYCSFVSGSAVMMTGILDPVEVMLGGVFRTTATGTFPDNASFIGTLNGISEGASLHQYDDDECRMRAYLWDPVQRIGTGSAVEANFYGPPTDWQLFAGSVSVSQEKKNCWRGNDSNADNDVFAVHNYTDRILSGSELSVGGGLTNELTGAFDAALVIIGDEFYEGTQYIALRAALLPIIAARGIDLPTP